MSNLHHAAENNTKVIVSYNPVTKQPIRSVPISNNEQLDIMLDEAVSIQPEWSSYTLKERSNLIKRVRKGFVRNLDEITISLAEETGKTHGEAFNEIFPTLEHLKYIAKEGLRYLKPETRKAGILKTKRGYVNYIPHGVVGIITPWNYPFFLATLPIAEALLAGNTVILKPSELTPLSGLWIHQAFIDAGVPEDVFHVATGAGDLGAALVKHDKTDMISFIGSVEVGKEIATVCGELMKPVLLELGGKDPMIVLEDANLERAANAAIWGGLTNCGQACISVERIYVVRSVADDFLRLLRKKAAAVNFGPDKENMDMGSLADDRQHAIVLNHFKDAVNRGGNITVGGKNRDDLGGYFIAPTIVENVDHDMDIMKHETFGPEISVMTVENEFEAIKKANDTTYGLSASVFSRNKKRAREIAEKIRAGSVCINEVMSNLLYPSLPFGGIKNSGIGRDLDLTRKCGGIQCQKNHYPFFVNL
jgi:succinate-semialdehyde dehydrogenase/glutarate-semialdehyde dehydrogenase